MNAPAILDVVAMLHEWGFWTADLSREEPGSVLMRIPVPADVLLAEANRLRRWMSAAGYPLAAEPTPGVWSLAAVYNPLTGEARVELRS